LKKNGEKRMFPSAILKTNPTHIFACNAEVNYQEGENSTRNVIGYKNILTNQKKGTRTKLYQETMNMQENF
jgi:hypothetical protein